MGNQAGGEAPSADEILNAAHSLPAAGLPLIEGWIGISKGNAQCDGVAPEKKYVTVRKAPPSLEIGEPDSPPTETVALDGTACVTGEYNCGPETYCVSLKGCCSAEEGGLVLSCEDSKTMELWTAAILNANGGAMPDDGDEVEVPADASSIYAFKAKDSKGVTRSLNEWAGHVCIVVNVASL